MPGEPRPNVMQPKRLQAGVSQVELAATLLDRRRVFLVFPKFRESAANCFPLGNVPEIGLRHNVFGGDPIRNFRDMRRHGLLGSRRIRGAVSGQIGPTTIPTAPWTFLAAKTIQPAQSPSSKPLSANVLPSEIVSLGSMVAAVPSRPQGDLGAEATDSNSAEAMQ